MKRLTVIATAAMATGVMLTGCAKDPIKNLDNDESRIYVTSHDSSVNFSAYNTFSIADSVAVIENNQLVEKNNTPFDQALRNAFISMMQQRGYQMVSKNDDPDLVVNLSRIYNNSTGIIDYTNYYGGYYGYYDPFYWGYPGYDYYFPPTVYGIYTIQEGGVDIDMFDAMNAATNNELKLVWNGLIRGSGTFDQNSVDKSVMALFDQSAYLNSN